MKAEFGGIPEALIQEKMNMVFCVIDQCQRGYRTWRYTKVLHHPLVRGKAGNHFRLILLKSV